MSSLITRILGSTGPSIEALPAQTLDQLWHEAEQLGRVSIEPKTFSDAYRARIRFDRKSGSTIWAEGIDMNAAFALAKAINEARDLGAGSNS